MKLLCRIAVCLLLGRAYAAQPVLTWEGRTMGTFYLVKIAGVEPNDKLLAELREAVDQRLDAINRQMSHYRPDSELSRFNISTSAAPFKVSAEFAYVTRQALELYRESDGAFDPTIGPLINLWGFGQKGFTGQVPPDNEITAARRICGARHLRVTDHDELQKDIPELQLNLSAVAKGYGADEIARLLRERGFTNVFASICGEIVASGVNPEGQPWRVGVERPAYDTPRGEELSATVPVSNAAISTSGDAHNFFRDESGRVYCHILDPTAARPVQNNVASVTVIAKKGMLADGLATTLFVLGAERGLRWVEAHPEVAALFIIRTGDGDVRLVPSKRFHALEVPTQHE